MKRFRNKRKYALTERQALTVMMALFTQGQDYIVFYDSSDNKWSLLSRMHMARCTVDAYETIASQRGNTKFTSDVVRRWRVRIAELQAAQDAKTSA